ncbi:GntR family transcriptional regulator [Nigerium massiliense]|uniref:GntR family transcriptional regulator n=1 Tax=Nigerium massiliense TaxID=1522317 RepID=UPI00058F26D5|nr:GntR family transcriptional regulator [Nigerium massiliense]
MAREVELPGTVDDGPMPKHEQLRLLIAQQARPGQAIPSERDLMAAYKVSRSTVRKAIDTLVADGQLRRSHGKGTFAVARPVESRLHLASFTQDMRRRGRVPSTVLLDARACVPPAEVTAALGLDADARVWQLERVRLADGEPMALEKAWYPVEVFPDLDRQPLQQSLYELFTAHYGVTIDAAVQTMWAESASAAVARRLDAPAATPLLVFRRRSTARDRPVEFMYSRYRGDRYQVTVSLDLQQSPEL